MLADKAIWQLYAYCYDQVNSSSLYQELVGKITTYIEPSTDKKILDAGCGTGNVIRALQKKYPDLQIIGIDHSQAMLQRANKKTESETPLLQHDLNKPLPFEKSTFDTIITNNVLYAVKDPSFVLSEFHRVLKPNGKLILSNPHDKSDVKEIMRGNFAGLNLPTKIKLFLTNLPIIGINLIIRLFGHQGTYHFLSEQQLSELLIQERFEKMTVEPVYARQSLFVVAYNKKGN